MAMRILASITSNLFKSGSEAMDLTRSTLPKTQAAAAAAASVVVPADAQNIAMGEDIQIQWSKAPCRFCCTGCGVMVGVKGGRVVATHGGCRRRSTVASTRQGLLPVQDHVRRMYGIAP